MSERSFLETGWMRLPAAANTANLTPNEFRVLAYLTALADDGQDPPNSMNLAMGCNMPVCDVRDALDVLESRHILTRENPSDWKIHSSETWV